MPWKRGGFKAFRERHPTGSLLLALAVGAVIGAGIAAAAVAIPLSSSIDDKDQQIADAQSRASTAESQLSDAESALSSTRSDLASAKGEIRKLTAVGKVPDLTGRRRSEAESLAGPYDWQLHFQTAPSDATEGTIISQSIDAGQSLARGQSITLTTAVPPPKQWTTIQTFTGATSLKTDPFQLPSGQLRISYTFGGHTNDIIDLNPLHGGVFSGDTLLNEIGSISGSTRVYDHPGTYYFDVTGESWSIELQQFK